MKRISTQLKGIATRSTYEDGEMYELVNLRNEGGVLQPVAPFKVEQEICGKYDLYYIHKNETYENWIGIILTPGPSPDGEGGETDIYWDINHDDCSIRKELKFDIDDVITGVEQSGNLLIFESDTTQYYALFRDGNYIWYGELPDLIPLEFNCLEEQDYHRIEAAADFPAGERGYGMLIDHGDEHITYDMIAEEIIGGINVSYLGWCKQYLDMANTGNYYTDEGVSEFGGLFRDAFFVRYAYRMYDNTNIKLSPPILIMPGSDLLSLLSYRYDTINTVPITYRFWVYSKYFLPGIKYDLSGLASYGGLIDGIDIFISPYIPVIDGEEIRNKNFLKYIPSPANTSHPEERVFKSITNEKIKKVEEMASFFLVKQLNAGDTTGGQYVPFPEKLDQKTILKIQSLEQQIQLQDNSSSHKTGAGIAYYYNGRLIRANAKTKYFRGFSRPFFGWDNDSLFVNGVLESYNGQPKISSSTENWGTDRFVIEVEIERGGKSGYVYTEYVMNGQYGVHSAMWSYPDINAKWMRVYFHLGNYFYLIREMKLTEHKFLNLSYYLEDGLNPVYISESQWTKFKTGLNIGGDFIYKSANELQVSEVNNPLVFDNKNVMTVGNGEIKAIGTNVQNTSNFNFGQYPLYVFCSDGIYTLKVGDGDVPFSAVSQAAFREKVTSGVLGEFPSGVAFVTSRGLFAINGSSVIMLSEALEERPERLHFQEIAGVAESVVSQAFQEDFKTYLQGVTHIVYNNVRNELIVCDASKSYSWVLSFGDMLFHKITGLIDKSIGNEFDRLIDDDGNVINISEEEGSADVVMMTRQLKYGTNDEKTLQRMALRGNVFLTPGPSPDGEGRLATVIVYHSNDGRGFTITRGARLKPEQNYKDIDSGLIANVKRKFYIVALTGKMEQGSKIELLESIIDKSYESEKMR